MKKLLAILLSIGLLCGALMIPVAARTIEQPSFGERILYGVGDAAFEGLLWGIGAMIPAPHIPRSLPPCPNFLPGTEEFLDEPAANAGWTLGYARASLIPPGLFDANGQYIGPNDIHVAGGLVGEGQQLFIERKTPTDLIDDMVVRVTAMDDGSGRGLVVFASLDVYALTSTYVRPIRRMVLDWAAENDVEIASINLAAMHQHSVIDTLGMNAPLLGGLLINPWYITLGWFRHHGTNPAFMEFLSNTTADTIIEAIEAMEPGALHYGYTDASEFMNARRRPYTADEDIHRLRFVPANAASRETWLVNFNAHTVSMGADTRSVTGDYIYYMEQRVNEAAGANFQMIHGAISAVGRAMPSRLYTPGLSRVDAMAAYGHALGDLLIGINNDTAVAPLLNIRHMEYRLPVTNMLHMLLFRLRMIEATGVRRHIIGPDIDIITETAYMELGNDLAIVFGPGEICPALLVGPSIPASEAYTGRPFEFTPLNQMARDGRRTIMFGIINDHSGYYQLPNDTMHFLQFGNEEINKTSTEAAAGLLRAMERIIDSID